MSFQRHPLGFGTLKLPLKAEDIITEWSLIKVVVLDGLIVH